LLHAVIFCCWVIGVAAAVGVEERQSFMKGLAVIAFLARRLRVAGVIFDCWLLSANAGVCSEGHA